MNILSIDLGTYSVKFLEFRADGRHLTLDHCQEVVINDVAKDFNKNLSISDLQQEIVKAYLVDLQFSGKIIQQIPRDLITHRFIELPVNNRKKAEQMIPHQLDDNLPYSITKAHFTSDLLRENNKFYAIVNITQTESFEQYFSTLSRNKILPTHMYSELSVFNNYAQEYIPSQAVCIIDMGHSTCKAYFIFNGRIVAAHSSYLAGKNITEMIAEMYQISEAQAIEYKHTKSFFLTPNQYNDVSEAQREFADIMKQTLSPFVTDFKRWELGFKVRHAISLEKILITGGTSNIENIENYLSHTLGLKVEKLQNLPIYRDKSESLAKNFASYTLGKLIASTQITKKQPVNFLRGLFSSGFSDTIAIHSTFFVASRVLIITAVICFGLFIDIFTQLHKEGELDKAITKQIKNPVFELSPKDIRKIKLTPKPVLTKLQKMERGIQNGIKALENSSNQGSIEMLVELSRAIGQNNKISMTSFNVESKIALATFSTEDTRELSDLEKRLRRSTLNDLRINFTPGETELSIEFRE